MAKTLGKSRNSKSRRSAKCVSNRNKRKLLSRLVAYLGTDTHVYLLGEITTESAREIQAALRKVKPTDPIVVHIDSIGGETFQGMGIYDLLSNHPGPVETVVEGVAASIASVILLAGKTRRMTENSVVMVHNPYFDKISGDASELKSYMDLAKSSQEKMINIYATGLKKSPDEISKWMAAETYFYADQAKEAGFVTDIISTPRHVARASIDKLVAKLTKLKQGSTGMDFKKWLAQQCEEFDLNPSKLTAKQKRAFKAKWNKLQESDPPPDDDDDDDDDDGNRHQPRSRSRNRRTSFADQEADEMERSEGISVALESLGDVKLNADYLKGINCRASTPKGLAAHALRNKWSVDKFELEARRATVQDIGHLGIHSRNTITEFDGKAHEVAILKACNFTAKGENPITKVKYGYEDLFDEKTLDASDKIRDISLLTMFAKAYRQANGIHYDGRLNTDGFLAAARESLRKLRATGGTSWTGLNIFDDAARKVLWGAFNSLPTTWQTFVWPVNVQDFRATTFYRLTFKGSYEQVGGDGQLKHGGITDEKFSVQAKTFGKIVGLSREDLINDDLGAFNGIMTALGLEGTKFLEELFWLHLMLNLGVLFPVDNSKGNYIAGADTAMGIDGLTLVVGQFGNQVDADNSPLSLVPTNMWVPTTLGVLADEIYTKTNVAVVNPEGVKNRPDGNPHVGKYRPIVAPYMNNTLIKQRVGRDLGKNIGEAIPNQSDNHYIVGVSPNAAHGGIVNGAFLNGKKTPTIEQEDWDFQQLGMQWRAYHDAGAGNGDSRLAIYVTGEAAS